MRLAPHSRCALVALAASLLCLPSAAQQPLRSTRGAPVPHVGFSAQGPSGLRIVAFQTPVSPRVTLGVSYRAGSTDDPPGKEGLAHLAEHLAFRARPGGGLTVWDRLEAAGVAFNAYTTADQTTFFAAGRPEQLAEMADAEVARLREPLAGIDERTFETERDVVISELRQRHAERPATVQIEWLAELAMPGHAYTRPVIGTEASLRAISLADVRAWIGTHYVPAAAIAVIASPLPAKDTASALASRLGPLFFGDGTTRTPPVVRKPPPASTRQGDRSLQRRTGPVEHPTLWIGWVLPGFYERQGPRVATALARVGQAVRRRLLSLKDGSGERYVDGVHQGIQEWDGASLAYLRVDLRDEADAQWALDRLEGALFHARSPGSDATGRDALLLSHYTSLEHGIDVSAAAQHMRAFGDPDYLTTWSRLVATDLTSGQDDFLEQWFRPGRAVALLVIPDRNPRPTETSAQGGDLPPASREGAWTPPARGVLDVARAPGLDRVQRRRLGNGLEVLVTRWGAAPVAEVRLAIRTELDGTPDFPRGTAALALSTLSWIGLDADRSRFGTAGSSWTGPGWMIHTERGSAGNLDALIDIAGRWARKASVSDRLSRMKEETIRSLGHRERLPTVVGQRELLASLFPGHPLGAPTTESSVRAITGKHVDAWVERSLRPERSTLVVVSSIQPDEVLWSMIEDAFGSWKGDGEPAEAAIAGPQPPRGRRVVIVDRPGATQPLVRIGVASPGPGPRDGPARDMLAALLGWTLERHLRMETGVTYGVHVRWLDHGGEAPLVLEAAVSAPAAVPALRTMLEAVAALAREPVPEAEVARARWQVARKFTFDFDTVSAAAAALSTMALHRAPPDQWERYPESLARVDAARIQRAASALGIGREAVVVLGDAVTLRPQLEAAGVLVDAVVADPLQRETPGAGGK